jgi:ActR/RegA family two-component response regulator
MSGANSSDPIALLLLDGDGAAREATTRALEGRGFQVLQAAPTDGAFALVSASVPDAVLLDAGADAAAALGLVERFRDTWPHVPVLVLAAEGAVELHALRARLGPQVLATPADVDHLANRVRNLVAGEPADLHEKRIADLMVPASAYERVYEDELVQRVIHLLSRSLFQASVGKVTEKRHRSVLVFSRTNAFLGCLRLNDILDLLIPPSRKATSAPFETGMFVGRCRRLGPITVGEILGEQRFVDIDAPLMEAVQLMVVDSLINIPVLKEGQLVGVLTDRNLLLEISNLVTRGVEEAGDGLIVDASRSP